MTVLEDLKSGVRSKEVWFCFNQVLKFTIQVKLQVASGFSHNKRCMRISRVNGAAAFREAPPVAIERRLR